MKKEFKIFFSWQSDTQKNEKHIIESALESAKNELLSSYGYEVVIDHSTLGESGMPAIDYTIMQKIDACDVFICDLTPIIAFDKSLGNGNSQKKEIPNPNVLLELGFAMSAVGDRYIIPVAHQGKWNANDLPFDINHKRVFAFNSSDCNLTQPILEVIKEIRKNGKHRTPQACTYEKLQSIIQDIKLKYFYKPHKVLPKVAQDSTTLFNIRMGKAFPGCRGLIEYTSIKDIKRALSILLEEPLRFQRVDGIRYSTQPIWWFRGGSALNIDKFTHLKGGKYLMGCKEVIVKRIVAYSSHARYYNQYVYVECEPDKPTGLYKTEYHIPNNLYNDGILEHITEEYGVYKYNRFCSKLITREEFEDGHTMLRGKVVSTSHKAELRVRFLSKYNFIIAAQGSVYNNNTFSRTSDEMFWKMMEHMITNEEFNDYMLTFKKDKMLDL